MENRKKISPKKNIILLLVLSALLAGCVAVYFLLPQGGETADGNGEDNSITIDAIDTSAVSGLVVEKDGKEIYSVEKKKDKWQFTDGTEAALDQDVVSELLDSLNPVTASQEIQMAEDQDLSQYGLDAPAMTIRVKTADGKSYEYMLGSTVPITGGYYGTTGSGDTVYCLQEEMYSTFDIEKISLIQLEELPQIDSSRLTSLKVDNRKGTDFEAGVGEDGKTWEIIKPDKKSLTEDDYGWAKVRGYFISLAYDSLADYQSDNLSEYGLKDPSSVVTITYYDEKEGVGSSGDTASGSAVSEIPEENREYKTLQLCIGNSCEDGYYVCEKGSSNVYIMAEDAVKNMIEVDEYGME